MAMQVSESLQNRAVRLHKMVYEALFRMLLNNFEASLPALAIDIFQQKEILIEKFKLNLCKDEFEIIFMSKEFREWDDLLVTHMNEMKSKGSDLEKFWLIYLDICELAAFAKFDFCYSLRELGTISGMH